VGDKYPKVWYNIHIEDIGCVMVESFKPFFVRQRSVGGFSIGSFNVLHFQSEGNTTSLSFEERQQKARQIAELIRSEDFAVVCLQECFRETSNGVISPAERITCNLNGGMAMGRYECIHCSRIYDELKAYGYKFRSENESRGEYAFIWDKMRVTLDKSSRAMIVYNAINERITRGLDAAITAGVAACSLIIRSGRNERSDKNDKEQHRNRLDKRDSKGKSSSDDALIGGVAGLAVIANHGIAMRRKTQIKELLQASLRPPFVGLFTMNHDKNKQLRLINVHTQWGRISGETLSGTAARNIEMRYLAEVVFPTVENQRSGFYETVFAVMAGDYNLTADSIARKISETKYGSSLRVAQRDSTKWYLTNPIEVAKREGLPIYEPIEKCHDYDHFIFSRPCWTEDSGRAIQNNPSFMVGEGYGRHPISDHYPVRLDARMI